MTDIPVTAPFDGSEITTVPNATREDVERALATAHGLYRDRDGWLSKPQRIEILRKAAEIIKERRQELAVAAAREGGKPLSDPWLRSTGRRMALKTALRSYALKAAGSFR